MFEKTYWSNILQRTYSFSVSSKAMRTIIKKGSFDKYILETPDKVLRSQVGSTLKEYMKKKLENPNWKVPYLKGQRKAWKSLWERERLRPYPVWVPKEYRHTDLTDYEFNRYDPNAPPRPEPLKGQTQEEALPEADQFPVEIEASVLDQLDTDSD